MLKKLALEALNLEALLFRLFTAGVIASTLFIGAILATVVWYHLVN